MKFISRIAIMFLAILTIWGCEREFDPVPAHLSDIFPLNEGKRRVYHVIDTSWASVNGVEGRSYYKKEETGDTEIDLLGRETFKLFIYHSPDTMTNGNGDPVFSWTYADLWTTYADENYAERSEGNIRYLVLKQPAVTGTVWNGNLYNSQNAETYEVLNDDTTIVLRGATFEHCVFVEQVPKRTFGQPNGSTIYIDEYAYEIYAPGIGKIASYRKYFEINSGSIDSDNSGVFMEEIVSWN